MDYRSIQEDCRSIQEDCRSPGGGEQHGGCIYYTHWYTVHHHSFPSTRTTWPAARLKIASPNRWMDVLVYLLRTWGFWLLQLLIRAGRAGEVRIQMTQILADRRS